MPIIAVLRDELDLVQDFDWENYWRFVPTKGPNALQYIDDSVMWYWNEGQVLYRLRGIHAAHCRAVEVQNLWRIARAVSCRGASLQQRVDAALRGEWDP